MPPPRSGQFTRQTPLGGLITLITAVSALARNVPGITAFNTVSEKLVMLIAVACPFGVSLSAIVTIVPPFVELGRKLLPVSVIVTEVFEQFEPQATAVVGLMEVSVGFGL